MPDKEKSSYVEITRSLAVKFNFECDIFHHELSGKTTEQAERATGLGKNNIIKCLLLKSGNGSYIGVIIRGSDRVDFNKLELVSKKKNLNMARDSDIRKVLGFEIGGVPALIFIEKGIPTFISEKVLASDYVVGSGGTEFHGMGFKPIQLITKLHYIRSSITSTG
jgi:prolyl-tRNA editing enzyme YbaK/EbsC (Cys-tRNA(Pro) deacylase)